MQKFFPCSLSQGLLPCVFVRGSISKPCSRNLFRHALSQKFSLDPFPGSISRAFFCIDGFHELFCRVIFSALSRGRVFGAIFLGASPCTFRRGEFHGFFRGDFFGRHFRRAFLVGDFAGASSVHSFEWTTSIDSFARSFS